MSSFKTKNIVRHIPRCQHCGIPCNNVRCNKCKLWNYKASKVPEIPESSMDIKDIYVINLEKDKQRLQSFFNLIKKQNISTKGRKWNRFNAIDGSNIDNINKEINVNMDKDITVNKEKILNYWKKKPGSIGCYLSHLKLWNLILEDENSGEYVLILEDDSYFTLNGMINLEIVMKTAKNLEWDILYIGHNKLKGHKIHPLFLRPVAPKRGENSIGINSGLYGYVVRKSNLQRLINIVKKFNSPFIDVQLRNCFGEFPALFVTSELIKHTSGKSSRTTLDKKKINL